MVDDEHGLEEVGSAARHLFNARSGLQPLDGLPAGCEPRSLDEAYAVQKHLNHLLGQAGWGKEVGHKIGCTTGVMQSYLGIDHPCSGSIFSSTLQEQSANYQRSRLCRPGVEGEIAVDIRRDITELSDPTPRGMADTVGAVRVSIELVDDRWTDFSRVATPSLVADNFFNAGCVVGPPVACEPLQLRDIRGRMLVNGEETGGGTGRDILGDPLAALLWLAEHQIERGQPLRAGQIVTLGSLVKTVWIDTGDKVEVELADIGRCALRLT